MPEISYPIVVNGRIVERIVEWVGDQAPAAGTPRSTTAAWTPELAHILVVEVMDVLYRLPPDGPRPVQSSMPDIVRDLAEAYGWEEVKTSVKPTKKELRMLDLTLPLLMRLENEKQRVALTGMACGVSLRSLGRRLACSHVHAGTLAKRGAQALADFFNASPLQFQEFMPTFSS